MSQGRRGVIGKIRQNHAICAKMSGGGCCSGSDHFPCMFHGGVGGIACSWRVELRETGFPSTGYACSIARSAASRELRPPGGAVGQAGFGCMLDRLHAIRFLLT
jgi:hypothetical protein